MKRAQLLPVFFLVSALGVAPVALGQNPTPQSGAPSPAAAPQSPAADASAPAFPADTPRPSAGKILVPTGTRLPLVLHNGISTRNAHPGDQIYLETLFPVLVDSRIVIPAGSYVSGVITEAQRPGRVKGRGELRVRLNTLIFPNGYSVNFNATPTGGDTGDDDSVDKEGKIKGASNKAGDVGTVAKTTGAGATIGAIAARSATGAGIGAGVGAAAGLAAVLLTRGPDLELPRGTTLDIALDRPLYLDSARVNFDDPGRASTLPGPPNRKPTRPNTPF
jgi:type IV secretion system protein VirB10